MVQFFPILLLQILFSDCYIVWLHASHYYNLITVFLQMESNQDASRDDVPDWPSCSANIMISLMKALDPLKESGCLGANKKVYYSSYPIFSLMTTDQKNKTLVFFNKLDVAKKSLLLTLCKHESAKAVVEERYVNWSRQIYCGLA